MIHATEALKLTNNSLEDSAIDTSNLIGMAIRERATSGHGYDYITINDYGVNVNDRVLDIIKEHGFNITILGKKEGLTKQSWRISWK